MTGHIKEKNSIQNVKDTFYIKIKNGTFWHTRVIFLRCLGFIYFVAFLVSLNQNKYLMGNNGLLPADIFIKNIKRRLGAYTLSNFLQLPTLFWFVPLSRVDFYLDAFSTLGMALSLSIIITGAANMIALFILWILYHSLVNIGQSWYSFGWESQLLETGFLALFFCPLWTWKKYPIHTPPSKIVVWGLRWLLFRIIFGAGMIKIRNDSCWIDLTCMNYHYETQPIPNPLSYYLHQMPEIIHKLETLGNHIVELVIPWFTIFPRPFRIICGIIQILFQVILIITGNYSFLNWLTILPSIAYFDDASLIWLLSKEKQKKLQSILLKEESNKNTNKIRRTLNALFGILLISLSLPVVINLFSSHQIMNTSYEPFRLVNTYGLFGTITKERTEIVIKGTSSVTLENAIWHEYEFKCKPGNVTRRPCIISPYHYRLDWLMWFAAFQTWHHNSWFLHFLGQLLTNDPNGAVQLLEYNPFLNKPPPRFIKADHYRYSYTKLNSAAAKKGIWWKRKFLGPYFPPVSFDMMQQFYLNFGWKIPKRLSF